jgi:ribonuclease-3
VSLLERALHALGLTRGKPFDRFTSGERASAISSVTGLPVVRLELYERALRHSSLARLPGNRHLESNERLEFLGDAVLGLAVAEHLFHKFPDRDEGFLTRVRSKLVNKKALAHYAEKLGLQPLLAMSSDMERAGGRLNPSLLANAFEALLGAIYLDHGYSAARGFVLETLARSVDVEKKASQRENYKSLLLEYAQARGWPQPQYRVVDEAGPGHERVFEVEVLIGARVYGEGKGKSKKSAEQRAARAALRDLEDAAQDSGSERSAVLTG